MSYLAQLRNNTAKYRDLLQEHMVKESHDSRKKSFPNQLSSINEMDYPASLLELCERNAGRTFLLTHRRESNGDELEEVILKVQGYLLDYKLPPLRQSDIPRNTSRIIDMKQSVTLTGLGAEKFDCAVAGVVTVYQMFNADLQRRGYQLRPWVPARDGSYLALTFANRYFTAMKEAATGEKPINLGDVIDPLNVLAPMLRSEVHLQENVVEYWQKEEKERNGRSIFSRIKPALFYHSHMVEVQVAFQAVRVGRREYVFLPKLHAICLLSRLAEREHNAAAVRALSASVVSPLKKIKRKVGYGSDSSDELEDEHILPQTEMKRMCIGQGAPTGDDDHPMT